MIFLLSNVYICFYFSIVFSYNLSIFYLQLFNVFYPKIYQSLIVNPFLSD